MPETRIISLLASATEIVCALGFEDHLVGRSHECDYPPSVKRLPVCSQPKIDIHGTSRELDDRVKAAVEDGLSIYRVDAEKLRELRPDVIVTQDHCEVCAVSLKDVEQAVCELVESRPRVVTLRPDSLGDVWDGIVRVAEELGVRQRGRQLVTSFQERLDELATKVSRLAHHPTVACLEWLDPLMAGGNWMPTLVRLAGGVNLFGEEGKHSPFMSWEQLVERDPEVIVALPCGWDIPKTREEIKPLTARPEWANLRAIRNRRVYMTDGNQYFNRPGPRLVESAEILAEVLHPGTFHFGHEGTGWERL